MYKHAARHKLRLADYLINRNPLAVLAEYGGLSVDHIVVERVAKERRFLTQLERFKSVRTKPSTLAELLNLMFKTDSAKQEFMAYYLAHIKFAK